MIKGVVVVLAVAAGCVNTSSVQCSDGRLCPDSTTCDDTRSLCLTHAQTTACASLADGQPCDAEGTPGICDRGLCEPGCGDGHVDPDEQCDDGNFASHDGCSSACLVEIPSWTEIANEWKGVTFHSLAYHAALGRIVMFGGQTHDGDSDSVWQMDPTSTSPVNGGWHDVTAALTTRPDRRWAAMMAYDSIRQVVVVYGGVTSAGVFLGDTWEYAATSAMFEGDNIGAWTKPVLSTTPGARYAAVMEFDPVLGKIVLYGGITTTDGVNGNTVGDTWTYDASGWTQLSPLTSPSPPRYRAAAAYDAARSALVLFGGAGSSTGTWEFDGSTWNNIPQTTFPPARHYQAMTYDSTLGKVVMFGGASVTDSLSDTWTYDGTWQQLTYSVSPSGRRGGAMVADPVNARSILVGGSTLSDAEPFDDVWYLGASGWTTFRPRFTPPAVLDAASAFDAKRGRLFVCDGQVTSTLTYTDETWAFDGRRWQQHTSMPLQMLGHAMAYDSDRDRVVLSTGSCNGDCDPGSGDSFSHRTFELDPASDTWAEVALSPPAELERYGATMVYDPVDHEMVLFGGQFDVTQQFTDTFTYDGTTWTRHDIPGPVGTYRPAMGWDAVGQGVILFDAGGTTWRYAAGAWSVLVAPSSASPPGRIAGQLAYDVRRARFVLAGGLSGTGELLTDVWELDPAAPAWTPLYVPGQSPLPRRDFVFAAHANARADVLFSGTGATSSPFPDTWVYQYRSVTPDENCTDGIDNDGDGQIDADNPDCTPPPPP